MSKTDDLIDRLYIFANRRADHGCDADMAIDAAETIRALLTHIETMEQSQRWMSVDERLPLEPSSEVVYDSTEYIVTDGEFVGTCDFQRGHGAGEPWAAWDSYGDIRPEWITHWMPLPAVPA